MRKYIPIYNSLHAEITRVIEAGIDKHLQRSFLYSPFRLFYGLFKKKNPNTIDQIRLNVGNDIKQMLSEIEGFKVEIFWQQHGMPTEKGYQLLKTCYNIGIRILKHKLNAKLAFRLLRDSALRNDLYEYILQEVRRAVIKHLPKEALENQQIN